MRPSHLAAEPMNGDRTPKRDVPADTSRNGSNGYDRIVDDPRPSRGSEVSPESRIKRIDIADWSSRPLVVQATARLAMTSRSLLEKLSPMVTTVRLRTGYLLVQAPILQDLARHH
jgi:hypothetical protein